MSAQTFSLGRFAAKAAIVGVTVGATTCGVGVFFARKAFHEMEALGDGLKHAVEYSDARDSKLAEQIHAMTPAQREAFSEARRTNFVYTFTTGEGKIDVQRNATS